MSENLVKAPRGRVKRTPIGVRNRLTVKNKDSNFEYRIVNDIDDRIEIFKENGWEIVEANKVTVGDKRLDSATPTGSAAEISVGQGTKAVVMRIKREWYLEDQAAKQRQVDATEQTMKEDAQNSGDYGSIKLSRD